jgi:hypothetical protein
MKSTKFKRHEYVNKGEVFKRRENASEANIEAPNRTWTTSLKFYLIRKTTKLHNMGETFSWLAAIKWFQICTTKI